MNPIFQHMNQRQQAAASPQTDGGNSVKAILDKLSPTQLSEMAKLLPQAAQIARQRGVSEQAIQAITQAVQGRA